MYKIRNIYEKNKEQIFISEKIILFVCYIC